MKKGYRMLHMLFGAEYARDLRMRLDCVASDTAALTPRHVPGRCPHLPLNVHAGAMAPANTVQISHQSGSGTGITPRKHWASRRAYAGITFLFHSSSIHTKNLIDRVIELL